MSRIIKCYNLPMAFGSNSQIRYSESLEVHNQCLLYISLFMWHMILFQQKMHYFYVFKFHLHNVIVLSQSVSSIINLSIV